MKVHFKLSDAKHPELHHRRKHRNQGQGGVLLTVIHKSINFYRMPESPETSGSSFGRVDYYRQTDTLMLGDFNVHHSTWYSSSYSKIIVLLYQDCSSTNFTHVYGL